jgi:HNH endonuclease
MARVPPTLRQAVIAAAQGQCAYRLSPEPMMGVMFEVDHIIPRSAGGRTRFDNLCLSCPTCNRHKARRLTARDPLSRRSVKLFHPNQDLWSHHFSWHADGTQIIGLTPTGRATVAALHFNRPAMTQLRRYWRATGIRFSDNV